MRPYNILHFYRLSLSNIFLGNATRERDRIFIDLSWWYSLHSDWLGARRLFSRFLFFPGHIHNCLLHVGEYLALIHVIAMDTEIYLHSTNFDVSFVRSMSKCIFLRPFFESGRLQDRYVREYLPYTRQDWPLFHKSCSKNAQVSSDYHPAIVIPYYSRKMAVCGVLA